MRTVLSLLTCSFLVAAASNPAAEKAVMAAHDAFNAAAKAGDAASLEKILGDDLVYGHSSAKIENKRQCIDALVKGHPDFRLEPGATVSVYGNTAVLHGLMKAHVNQNGKANVVPLDLLQVWVKTGSRWIMVARHTTRTAQ
ncbi:MAG: nuclear transport factor 2 family protein [Bryobacteraceae bacterium]